MDSNKVYKRFLNILSKYQYEFNSKYIRNKICNELTESLHIFVFDETTPEMEDQSKQLFMVKINDNYSITLLNYMENYNYYQRNKKINNLKKRIKYDN